MRERDLVILDLIRICTWMEEGLLYPLLLACRSAKFKESAATTAMWIIMCLLQKA